MIDVVGAVNAGNQPSEIVEQDEEEDAGDVGLKALIAVADDLLGLTADELVDHLGDLLRRVGLLHRERQPHKHEKGDEAGGNQQFQREAPD